LNRSPEALDPAQSHPIQLLWRGRNPSLFAGEIMGYENLLSEVKEQAARIAFNRTRAFIRKRPKYQGR
jgi:hypothetical protein